MYFLRPFEVSDLKKKHKISRLSPSYPEEHGI